MNAKHNKARFSITNQDILRRFVAQEVICCVSMLVHHFANNPESLEGSDYSYDEILDLCRNPDHEASFDAWLEEIADTDDLIDILEEDLDIVLDRDDDDDVLASDAELREMIQDSASSLDYEEQCRKRDIDIEYREVYEHWVVSPYLKNQLKHHGETVGELFGLDIWGRCTTGQAILLDGVIVEIAADMEILEGQRYAWSSR